MNSRLGSSQVCGLVLSGSDPSVMNEMQNAHEFVMLRRINNNEIDRLIILMIVRVDMDANWTSAARHKSVVRGPDWSDIRDEPVQDKTYVSFWCDKGRIIIISINGV